MNRTFRILFCALALPVIAPYLPGSVVFAAQKDSAEVWRIREQLVSRLTAEWYKIGVLSKELSHVQNVLADIRDIEIFPSVITGIRDNELVEIDRKIEKLEKNHLRLTREVDAFRTPLADALAIMREMVIGEPVEQMFNVIETGDLRRIDHMLKTRRGIRALWTETDSLLVKIMDAMSVPRIERDEDEGAEDEFFEIIRVNLGLQYQAFHEKLAMITDVLARRSTAPQLKQMMTIELNRVRKNIENEEHLTLAHNRLLIMKKRYEESLGVAVIDLLIARVEYLLGRYHNVIKRVAILPDTGDFQTSKTVFTLQSLYMLQEYESLWERLALLDVEKFQGRSRNMVIWLTMECARTLGKTDDLSIFVSKMEKDSSYAHHILYAFAQSLVAEGEYESALTVLQNAQKMVPPDAVDREVFERIRITVAQLSYMQGDYKNALSLFFELLDQERTFEEALFGIIWSYIQLGQHENAERSLRKLINQSPESVLAVEAILTLAKRYVSKADYEWRKKREFRAQRARLDRIRDRLGTVLQADTDTNQTERRRYVDAMAQVNQMIVTMEQEGVKDYQEIAQCYMQADRICNLADKFYATGSFQENAFSSRREKLLYDLDSVLVEVKKGRPQPGARKSAVTDRLGDFRNIKTLVRTSRALKVRIMLKYYQWERDYIDWMKTLAKSEYDSVGNVLDMTRDSVTALNLSEQRMTLMTRLDSLVGADDRLREMWYDRLIEACHEQLNNDISDADRAYIRYHLGELHYARENDEYMRLYGEYEMKMAEYDTLLEHFRNGTVVEMPVKPEPPLLDHDKSMHQFLTILREHPGDSIIPAVLYGVAWCFNDLGRQDSAVIVMKDLATGYPAHTYAPQAWLYTGEYMFDNGRLEEAVEAYQAVMDYPESKWFDDALYKFAWAQYRLSNPEKAISSFLALVELGDAAGTGKAMLTRESMDYIAISFSETDMTGEKGLARAIRFVERFDDKDKGAEVMFQLGRVYRDQGRYELAAKTFDTIMDMHPGYKRNWVIEGEKIALLERDMPVPEANEQKMNFFETYNASGSWAATQADQEAIAQADSAAQGMLYDVGISFHQLALEKNNSELYNRALQTYERFIRSYPVSPKANECHYNLAEILFSQGDYYRATEEYMAVSKRYPDSKYRETAAWNAIVASQNLLKQEQPIR